MPDDDLTDTGQTVSLVWTEVISPWFVRITTSTGEVREHYCKPGETLAWEIRSSGALRVYTQRGWKRSRFRRRVTEVGRNDIAWYASGAWHVAERLHYGQQIDLKAGVALREIERARADAAVDALLARARQRLEPE